MKKSHLLTLFVAVLAIVFGAASAQAAKVDVCHIPPGNPDNWHTISVSENALQAHLNHGDLEGSCVANCESLCDDGNACTIDIESDTAQCICLADPRPAVDCDDGNECTVDACNSETGCTYDSDVLACESCDDGDAGTSGEFCIEGACVGGLTASAECPCEDIFDFAYSVAQPLECFQATICGRPRFISLVSLFETATITKMLAPLSAGEAACEGTLDEFGDEFATEFIDFDQHHACAQRLLQDAADFNLPCPDDNTP